MPTPDGIVDVMSSVPSGSCARRPPVPSAFSSTFRFSSLRSSAASVALATISTPGLRGSAAWFDPSGSTV